MNGILSVMSRPWWPLLATLFAAGGAWHTLSARVETALALSQQNARQIELYLDRVGALDVRLSLLDSRLTGYMSESTGRWNELQRAVEKLDSQLDALVLVDNATARELATLTAVLQSLKERLGVQAGPKEDRPPRGF